MSDKVADYWLRATGKWLPSDHARPPEGAARRPVVYGGGAQPGAAVLQFAAGDYVDKQGHVWSCDETPAGQIHCTRWVGNTEHVAVFDRWDFDVVLRPRGTAPVVATFVAGDYLDPVTGATWHCTEEPNGDIRISHREQTLYYTRRGFDELRLTPVAAAPAAFTIGEVYVHKYSRRHRTIAAVSEQQCLVQFDDEEIVGFDEITANYFLLPTCTCDWATVSSRGCQCGAMQSERQQND